MWTPDHTLKDDWERKNNRTDTTWEFLMFTLLAKHNFDYQIVMQLFGTWDVDKHTN